MRIELYQHQIDAIDKMKNGSILCGGVGTGKSRTALAYYYMKECLGSFPINGVGKFMPMKDKKQLYIITTAKKRDSLEWNKECCQFNFTYKEDYIVDSWNNIKKYKDVTGAFFIFDEQRVIGYGAWTKAFLKITKHNHWVLLSATPGDTWSDYIPVFVANGFYKGKGDFEREHCVFNPYTKYRKVERYIGISKLNTLRTRILIPMEYRRLTVRHDIPIKCNYDKEKYAMVVKRRWDPYDNEPIQETGKLCYLMRKVTNSDVSRTERVLDVFRDHPKLIIFYNFSYELRILRRTFGDLRGVDIGEWNGEVHSEVPSSGRWVYFVQYTAGSEGWNCIATDTVVFYSQSYSFKATEQARGRIDRINTSFKDLYYYKFYSDAPIDKAIDRALRQKQNFNERSFLGL